MSGRRAQNELEHLFDATLVHQPGMTPIVPAEDGDGTLVGSGDGTVSGPAVDGALRWTLFEVVGETACSMAPTAIVETADGASIRIDGRGWARRTAPTERQWSVAATLRFATSDERYAWLNDALGHWHGTYDETLGTARYRAYAASGPDGRS